MLYPYVTVYKHESIYNNDNCRFCVHYSEKSTVFGIATISEIKQKHYDKLIFDISKISLNDIGNRNYFNPLNPKLNLI